MLLTNKTIKKILKRGILISLVFAILAFFALIFIIKYRIKSIIKEVVRKETNGVYDLDFSKISINFYRSSVKLRAVDFKPVNTYPGKKDYRIKINDLYFSLDSWKQLFFHRKLFVDSLQINQPDIILVSQPAMHNKNALDPINEIFKSLENISEIFKVRVLEINRGKMCIHTGGAPVVINNINLRIENFGQKNKQNTHLRYSDNITLNIANQHWIFPTGQTIGFKNLFFSGKDQFFKVDSCSITMAPDDKGQRTSVYAEMLLFRTNELESIFDKNELNLDTLYCKSPILSFAMPGKKAGDTVDNLNEAIHQLPGNINVKYINIENGQVHLTSSNSNRSYTGKKTDIKIYRLNIDRNSSPSIHTGNIELNLNEISFASQDSLYLLTVNEFKLDSNNLVCRDAFLKPSAKAKSYLSGIRLPAFTLFDISLNDLLEKRLKAQVAVFEKPHFFFVAGATKKKTIEKSIPVDKFYNTLEELAKLIDVRWLTIKSGELDYHASLSKTPALFIKDIDAEIDLIHLLHSSFLLATKQAIHGVRIGTLKLNKGNTSIDLENIFLNGYRQLGKMKSLRVHLSSGIQFNAADLYWERFSWEHFLRDRSIHIDTLSIPAVSFVSRLQHGSSGNKGTLLPLTIKNLNIGELGIDLKTKNNTQIKATVSHIALKELTTRDSFFAWQSMGARADNILFNDSNKRLAVQRLNVFANGESNMQNIEYHDIATRIKIPEIKFQLFLNDSRLQNLEFPYLSVTDGYFNYKNTNNPISIAARFDVNILNAGIEKNNKEPGVFGRVFLNVDSLAMIKPVKKGFIEIANLMGRVEDYPLSLKSGDDNALVKSIIKNVIVTEGRVVYNDSATQISVSKLSANGKEARIAFKDVEVKPRNTLDSFLKTAVWQKDYLTFHFDSISLDHIDSQAFLQDSALVIRYVYLQDPVISTFRNKNIAFQHGIEKLMPTRLIAGLKIPLQIDSVQIKGASVNVHEVSAITQREGIVPLRKLDALFKNVVSRPNEKDSLVLEVTGQVLNYKIHPFRYAESYHDSLSGFTMNYGISTMKLSHLTEVTNPLSAIAITKGQADTLYAKLSGNKYASTGEINFLYRDLRIRLLNKEDTLKKSIILSLETLLANGLIKSKNKKQARMFFVRDREKFVFNYWVKTLFSGIATSAGVKRNSKYKRMYKEAVEKYSLPAAGVE